MEKDIIKDIRRAILNMVTYSKSSHVGSCLSVVEILYTLYFKIMKIYPDNPSFPERDKLILSKGHASAALYATLAARGFFPKELLSKFYIDQGSLPGHLDKDSVPGIEASAGSLGHGLSIGIGMALANKINKNPGRIYVVSGDGECNEGSIWEAVMLAPNLKLNNLTVIIDFNKIQGFGRTEEIINQDNLVQRFQTFGWEASEIDGHNIEKLEKILSLSCNGPKAIIANTIKGKGISFMEDRLEWHYKSPNPEQFEQAIKEIDRS